MSADPCPRPLRSKNFSYFSYSVGVKGYEQIDSEIHFAAACVVSTILIGSRCLQYGVENHRLRTIGGTLAQYTNQPPEAVILSDIYINAEDFLNIAGMQSENSDVVGYIRVDGTYIDYPVLKSEDQDKYLQRDFLVRNPCMEAFLWIMLPMKVVLIWFCTVIT